MISTDATREELDNNQYTTESILEYEQVYGQHFVSPGGAAVARKLISTLSLEQNACVLDAGCGLGGSAFLMASEFELQVTGIDLSENMISMAASRLDTLDLADRVQLQAGNCMDLTVHNHFDAVYSRDVFLHIANKNTLFSVLYSALKPGGKLLFTDYCCGQQPWQSEFVRYVNKRGYSLQTLPDYARLVKQAGFTKVNCQDRTRQFIEILESELETIRALNVNDVFVTKMESAWLEKLDRANGGDQRWGLITATKPVAA